MQQRKTETSFIWIIYLWLIPFLFVPCLLSTQQTHHNISNNTSTRSLSFQRMGIIETANDSYHLLSTDLFCYTGKHCHEERIEVRVLREIEWIREVKKVRHKENDTYRNRKKSGKENGKRERKGEEMNRGSRRRDNTSLSPQLELYAKKDMFTRKTTIPELL